MADDNEEVHLTKTEARAGTTPGVTRYILLTSLALVIVIFAAYLIF